MVSPYTIRSFEVGDGARHFENTVVRTSREIEPLHRVFQKLKALGVGHSIPMQIFRTHLRIAINTLMSRKALLLYFARFDDTAAHGLTRLRRPLLRYFFERHRHDLYLYIDAVE